MRPLFNAPATTLAHLRNQLITARPDVSTLFVDDILPALYTQAVRHRLDLYGMVGQSYLETGGGHFLGSVRPWFRNTCGLKVQWPEEVRQIIANQFHNGDISKVSADHPLVHSQWHSWETGAMAQAQHLCAYANVPVPDPVVDPRWSLVWGKHAIRYWEELSGRWAGTTYGQKVLLIADAMESVE